MIPVATGLFAALAITAPWLPASPLHDSTWPPQKDPTSAAENHPPSSPVYVGSISFDFPTEYEPYFGHTHGPNYDGVFAFGDIVGVDDGEQHVVIAMPGEAVMAAKYTIDFPSQTGTFEPLWFWLSPWARDPSFDLATHQRWKGFNILLDDFDGDGKNEVAVNSAELIGGQLKPVMFLLQTDESDPLPPTPFVDENGQPFPDPAPVELARTFPNPLVNQWAERLGNCKVTDSGRQIVMHDEAGFATLLEFL